MSDWTRQKDFETIQKARDSSTSTREREQFDKLKYQIQRQGQDSELTALRQELVGSVHAQTGKQTKKLNERIRDLTIKKGLKRK